MIHVVVDQRYAAVLNFEAYRGVARDPEIDAAADLVTGAFGEDGEVVAEQVRARADGEERLYDARAERIELGVEREGFEADGADAIAEDVYFVVVKGRLPAEFEREEAIEAAAEEEIETAAVIEEGARAGLIDDGDAYGFGASRDWAGVGSRCCCTAGIAGIARGRGGRARA